jgi:hypothetical protein
MEHLTDALFYGNVLTLLTNIRLVLRIWTTKNTSLKRKFINYEQKSFITLAPGVDVTNSLFSSPLTKRLNKLERLPHSSFYDLIFACKARSQPYIGANSLWQVLALLANIRLGLKDLPETNTRFLKLFVEKSFITLTPGANVIKLFTSVINDFS